MREIEVLKLKIKDQVVISNISTILKQLGHEETLNKSHELAEILISKISTLEKSFKSQRSEEKKQILTKEQHKFKEILRFLIEIKRKAFELTKTQSDDLMDIKKQLIQKEKKLDEIMKDIMRFENENEQVEDILRIEEKSILEIKEEIDGKIKVMVENVEFLKKSAFEEENLKKVLNEKTKKMKIEEKAKNVFINNFKIFVK